MVTTALQGNSINMKMIHKLHLLISNTPTLRTHKTIQQVFPLNPLSGAFNVRNSRKLQSAGKAGKAISYSVLLKIVAQDSMSVLTHSRRKKVSRFTKAEAYFL